MTIKEVQRLIVIFNWMQTRTFGMLDEKDRMLSAIGHDLRTPLASLRLRAESVGNEGERPRMIATINEMARTLEKILSLARPGRWSESPLRVNLTALLDALAQDLHDRCQPVTFKSGQRMLARLRPVLMCRPIRNLIENASNMALARRFDSKSTAAKQSSKLRMPVQAPPMRSVG